MDEKSILGDIHLGSFQSWEETRFFWPYRKLSLEMVFQENSFVFWNKACKPSTFWYFGGSLNSTTTYRIKHLPLSAVIMSASRPKLPTLDRLRGDFLLIEEVRNSCSLDQSILRIPARSWSDYKVVIAHYFENAETWEDPGMLFCLLLQDTFKKIKDLGKNKLLSNYCDKLHHHYTNSMTINDMQKFYSLKELKKRADHNEVWTSKQI